jgi:hypothetical protein
MLEIGGSFAPVEEKEFSYALQALHDNNFLQST